MNSLIRIRPEAEHDLSDAASWYESQRAGLGHEFLDEVEAVFSTIAATPFIYPIVHRNTRRAIMRRFPFCVYYRLVDRTPVIFAVMHGSRNPRRWKNRQ